MYLEDSTDLGKVVDAVNTVSEELKEQTESGMYRLIFRSLSTSLVSSDISESEIHNALQRLTARVRRDKAVGMYLLEKGMHSENEYNIVGHTMEGSIEFKVRQLKTYLCVKGITDVQSRADVRYTHSRKALSIGSFALDRIRE